MEQKLALIGLGTVGRGLIEILDQKRELLSSQFGYEPRVVAVSDIYHGSCQDPDGLDLGRLLELVARGGAEPGCLSGYADAVCEWDSLETIRQGGADAVVEVTVTNIETGEPAMSHGKRKQALALVPIIGPWILGLMRLFIVPLVSKPRPFVMGKIGSASGRARV